MECVLESAWLAWCVHVLCPGSANNFFDAGFVPDFAASPQSHAWEAVLAPFPDQVRGPSELARVLPQRDGVVRAGAGAWAAAVNFLSTSEKYTR